MKKNFSLALHKPTPGSKILILLMALLCLGGAWKLVRARIAAAAPYTASSAPYAYQVKDINPTTASRYSGSVAVGDTLFFGTISGKPDGNIFWKTDGTLDGTVKVLSGYATDYYTAADGGLYFTAYDPDTDEHILFYSDGTQAGTKEVKRWENSYYFEDLVYADGVLFLKFWSDQYSLWASDGTLTGTVQLGSFLSLDYMKAMGSTLYFGAHETTESNQLWKSDGTPGGTVMVKDINPGSEEDVVAMFGTVGDTLYFGAQVGAGVFGLWTSDGTEAGTTQVKGFSSPDFTTPPGNLTDVNGTLFFSVSGPTSSLWKSDGSEAGTVKVKDISFIDLWSDFEAVNGALIFQADDGVNGVELWRSDGSEAGTALVKDIYPGIEPSSPGRLTGLGGVLFFTADDGATGKELWRSDGTADGTLQLKDFNPGADSTQFEGMTPLGGKLLFFADPGTGLGLWQSTGTSASTTRIQLISPVSGPSSPTSLFEFNGQAYFAADDGEHGYELWKSDSSAAGTALVADINTGSESSFTTDSYPVQVAFYAQSVGDTLFFMANDGEHGSELWKTDGTGGGTALVKDIFPGSFGGLYSWFTEFNGELWFVSGAGHRSLWKSDGTEAGTELIQEYTESWGLRSLLPISNTLYFVKSDDLDPELWKTDGTISGTQMVKGFSFVSGNMPDQLTDLGETLFFAADDGLNGYELWKSDGTLTGTVMVKDIVPGSGGTYLDGFLNVNGVLYMHVGPGGNMSLWKSDGTEPGTVKVKDFVAIMDYCVSYQDKVYFTADDGVHGYELWQSDGTEAGTVMVKDLNPAGNSSPWSYSVFDGLLYFTAVDEAGGRELWRSDGTAQGTALLADIYPGAETSDPMFFEIAADLLLFSADNGTFGAELFAVNSGAGLQPVFLPLLRR